MMERANTNNEGRGITRLRIICVALTSGLVLLFTGCGDGLARVSGHVTLDGQPLRSQPGKVRVAIKFQPASGVGPVAVGLANENATYTLGTGSRTGILPGDYLV